jgi:HK97 family phage portal protein
MSDLVETKQQPARWTPNSLWQRWRSKATTFASGLNLTDPRLYFFLTGGPTSSGEVVSIDTAMQIDSVWACVRLIAGTISTLPMFLFKRDAEGYGIEARDHPLFYLLHDQANAEMTAVTFWDAMVACLMLWGNCYAMIDRRGDGEISAMTPMRPDRLTIHRNPDGSLTYRYTWMGIVYVLDDSQVFHVKGFSLDGYQGISPIGQAREQLGLALAADRSAASMFRNGMRPSMVFTAPNYMTKSQRAEYDEEFREKFVGSINAGKVPLLEGGWKLETLSMNPDDAQLLATRAFSIETICRWYGIQPVMIGHMEKSTAWGTGLEQMNLWFLTYTLRPLLKAIEQEISRSLLKPTERRQYYAEFNVEGLLRADSAGRANMMKVQAENGLRTRNELRALDNMPPMDGGDDLTVAVNLMPAQLLGKEAQPQREKLLPDPATGTPPPSATPTSQTAPV